MIPARTIHRFSAIILGLFVISHLAVHLTAVLGIDAHIESLELIQSAYRNLVGEIVLVIAILIQIATGARRLRFKSIDGWARLQVVSGCYLLIFLLMHTSAAVYTHHIFNLETDFYWAAGSLHFTPIKYGFAIYYFAAVLAFFTHMAAAVHFRWNSAPAGLKAGLVTFGAVVGALIVCTFAGVFYPIEISPEVEAYYQQNFGDLGLKEN